MCALTTFKLNMIIQTQLLPGMYNFSVEYKPVYTVKTGTHRFHTESIPRVRSLCLFL